LLAVDHGLVYANLGLLAAVSFLPFPTAVLADYLREGGNNEKAAAALYGITMIGISVAFWAMWMHLRHHSGIVKPDRTADIGRQAVRAGLAIGIYAAATAVGFASAGAALALYGAVALAFAFNRLR
jgi:uncharacterized membrane protein